MHTCQMALSCDSCMLRFVVSVRLADVVRKIYGAQLCCTRQNQWKSSYLRGCLKDHSEPSLLCAVQAARAPLLVAVLQGYRGICGEAWQTELRSVFPHLTHLICSAQPSVRTALADLLQAQIPNMIS